MSSWIPLCNHSQYSVLQSTISIQNMVDRACDQGFEALGITDSGNLYAAVDFYKACKKAEIKPLIGAKLFLAPQSRHEKKRLADLPNSTSIFLFVKNKKGYENLCYLSSMGYLEGFYYVPRIDEALLFEHSEGLICISGSDRSPHAWYSQNRSEEELNSKIEDYKRVFGEDFYLSIQDYQMDEDSIESEAINEEAWLIERYEEEQKRQGELNKLWLRKSKSWDVSLLAIQESFYMDKEDWKAHEVLLNVQSGEPIEVWQRDSMGKPTFKSKNPKRDVIPSHRHHFRSQDEMEALFKDHPEALSMSSEIASKCQFDVDFETKHYPSFVPPGLDGESLSAEELKESVATHLRKVVTDNVPNRYTKDHLKEVAKVYPDRDPLEVVMERINRELDVIIPKGLGDYLLIVSDFIIWAKSHNIPVGPGRGSGAGSITCYLLGITDIEPLRFNLFFERFINPERISYPDIDVDICMQRRSEVIDYMLQKYGKECVAQIITFGTMKAKMSIKDVGRVLNIPLSKVNELAKLFPDDLNITLEGVLEDSQIKQLYETDEETKQLFDMARVLEGCVRNTGIHAAGLIICADPLAHHIPLCMSKDAAMPVTQYSMKPAESVGMLKIDFLGLKTLTSIQKCVDAIEEDRGVKVDWFNLPLEDSETFNLLNQGKTLGVFQVESGGMQDLARQLHLDKFEEILAVVALYRPGPMDMIPSFINRKHGVEPIEYDHPKLKNILSETYGIMVYQEQVMQIANDLAGFSLAEGDVLRKAMGKKDAQEMANQRVKFINGAEGKGIDKSTAVEIFDKMEKFAAYGFNKSHAAAYGYIAYVTAFLKANYPMEWMAALMTCDRDDISKIAKFIAECKAMGIEILAPDVNEATNEFRATPKGIRFAMSAVKGVGHGVVDLIIAGREKGGPFKSMYDFMSRVDIKKVGKKTVELLVDAGGFDFTDWTRDQLRESIEPMMLCVVKSQEEESKGVMNLFSSIESEQGNPFEKAPKVVKTTGKSEVLFREKELLGFYLTGHPMDQYSLELKKLSSTPLGAIATLDRDAVIRTAFVVETVSIKVSQRTQKKFAILSISDGMERYELPIWSDLYDKHFELLVENKILCAVLSIDTKEGLRLNCRWIEALDSINESTVKACDDAYDKAKFFMHRQKFAAKSGAKPVKKQETKEQTQELKIYVDANKAKFSQMIRLKEIFSENMGSSAVEIIFRNSPKRESSVYLGAERGVRNSQDLKKALLSLEAIDECV